MIIDSYDVRASSQRSYTSVESTTMTVKRGVAVPPKKEEKVEEGDSAELNLTDAVKEMLEKQKQFNDKQMEKLKAPAMAKLKGTSGTPSNPDELKLSLLEKMIEALTGKKFKFSFQAPTMQSGNEGNGLDHASLTGGGQGRPQVVDMVEYEHFNYESERVSYQAQGVVKTADGKTINVDISMYMSREFASYTSVSVQQERPLCDPLVVNYGGTAASLSGETFAFDLTMDGKTEQIAKPGEGNGFLALDKNGDGVINDGSELFGPQTGSGFDELRRYDGDGNNWIDENDDVFSKLTVWSKDKDGNDQLFTLKELGIGAIYLGDVETQFSFKNDENQTTGVMRSTSFFLTENGGAGTISHVDLSV